MYVYVSHDTLHHLSLHVLPGLLKLSLLCGDLLVAHSTQLLCIQGIQHIHINDVPRWKSIHLQYMHIHVILILILYNIVKFTRFTIPFLCNQFYGIIYVRFKSCSKSTASLRSPAQSSRMSCDHGGNPWLDGFC